MTNSKRENPLKIGILGLGTVGQALINQINKTSNSVEQTIEIAGVSARTRYRQRTVDISHYVWFDDPVEMARSSDIDVLVEVAGGTDTALKAAEAALLAGKHLVTANKAMLAEHGEGLIACAEEQGRMIGFEAAVCGAIPAVKVLREALAGNTVDQVQGIFNGTCNYIFAQMAAGESFADALKDAQEKGFAEADPTLDIGGGDAAHKTALMANLITKQYVPFDQVYVEGIANLPQQVVKCCQQNGHVVKLLGQCRHTPQGWAVWVYPAAVPNAHPFAQVHGVTNAVSYQANAAGFGMLLGAGAGGSATASSVMSDVIDIALGRNSIAGGLSGTRRSAIVPISDRIGANWVADKSLANLLREKGAHVQEAVQGLIVERLSEAELLSVVPNIPEAWLRIEGM